MGRPYIGKIACARAILPKMECVNYNYVHIHWYTYGPLNCCLSLVMGTLLLNDVRK